MTPEEIAETGRRIFGDRWKHQMAYALGVSTKTVQRWSKVGSPKLARQAIIAYLLAEAKRRDLIVDDLEEKP